MEDAQKASAYNELGSYAEKILCVCHNLNDFVAKFPDLPLARLARDEVLALKMEARALSWMIIALRFRQTEVEGDEPVLDSSDLCERVLSTKAQMFRALAILDFSLRNSTRSEDGELNAIFASIFLLDKPPTEADDEYPLHMQVRTAGCWLAFAIILSHLMRRGLK